MSKPTRRNTKNSKPRVRSNSTRFTAAQKTPTQKTRKKKGGQAFSSGIGSQPSLWTKEKPQSKTAFLSSRSALTEVFSGIGRAFGFVFGKFFTFIARNKTARILAILVCLVLACGAIDTAMNWGKIYPGVKIGELDLGGKSSEEASKLIEDTYASRLTNKRVYIFANEDASQDIQASLAQTNDEQYADHHSVEDALANRLVWQTDAASLGAKLDTKKMVEDALALGRENGGIFTRLGAFMGGYVIDPWLRYDEEAVEKLAGDIDLTIGNARVNYGVSVVDGHATVTEGHDGTMIDRNVFTDELNESLLGNAEQQASFVAHAEYVALQIDEDKALQTCALINQAISHGARFAYHEAYWDVDASELGSWIQTDIVEGQGHDSWILVPHVSYDLAKTSLLNHLRASFNESEVAIRFTNENGNIQVHTQSSGTMPKTQEAIDALNEALFSSDAPTQERVYIETQSTPIPPTLSLEDAKDVGVIEEISSFTTEYTANVENRNHNIHLVSELLNNSIVDADGGIWSFNEVAGNCNEEAGFKGAGSIINDEYVDEIGGGICQVATTVFNAVYSSGLPILERHNHSLYIASYPAGRDAAVSWPDLDLRWKNNTSSDILVQTAYTDTSITVALYGVSPDYQVTTETGKWEEGEKYSKRTTTDKTLAPNTSYIKIHGSDGSKITIVRTVADRQGNIVSKDTFASVYEPKDEIVVEGPKKEEENTTEHATTS